MPDLITNTDIAPNAGILGTQIADKTLQLRNLSDDVFGIVATGTIQVSSSGSTVNSTSHAHGLSFTPIVMGFLNNSSIAGLTTTGSVPLPTWGSAHLDTITAAALTGGVATPAVIFNTWIQIFADATNVYALLLNATGSAVATLTITYYLLEESANVP